MTDKLEGDTYITLHMVWPIYLKLFGVLAESDNDKIKEADGIYSSESEMKRLGRDYMEKNRSDFKPTFHHKAMTFLNPTMKKLNLINFSERMELHNDLEAHIKTYEISDKSTPTSIYSQDNVSSQSSSFLDCFVSFDEVNAEATPDSEISNYVKHPIISNVNLSKWWCDHSKTYPKLSRLFLKLSCIPATSASSERGFSTSGHIITDKRSMILPDNVNNLIIARNDL